ncbi:MAG TPA: hypothetical protein VI485_25905 [Vicinamibacterales bacterium]|nr:hypothetical protein [Vicinamibacterales bacterium]
MRRHCRFGTLAVLLCLPVADASPQTQQDTYVSWSAEQAETVGRSMRADGRAGGRFDTRILKTDRAYNYKLRATWLTPEVIRASARIEQLRSRLSDEQTRALVAEAEAAGHTVILVEIDPREGSGVIPLDWRAVLQAKDWKPGMPGSVLGVSTPQLKLVKALAGVVRRDYSYDVFWVVFPLLDDTGAPVFADAVRDVELVVGIHEKEGAVRWPVPASIRQRALALSQKK